MNLIILLGSLFFSSFVSADIYEIIDANGHKTYTDKPPLNKPDAMPLSLKPETGNSWSNDSIQEGNEEYYEELNAEEELTNNAEATKTEETNAQQEKAVISVEEAEIALEEAKEIKAGDYLPNLNQGIHNTQEYQDRVNKAEEALNKAKEDEAKYQ